MADALPNLSPSEFLKHYRLVGDAKREFDRAADEAKAKQGIYRSALKAAKKSGVNQAMLIEAMRIKTTADEAEVAMQFRDLGRYLRYLNSPLGEQFGLFDDGVAEVPADARKEYEDWEAHEQGYRAAQAGVPAPCLHPARPVPQAGAPHSGGLIPAGIRASAVPMPRAILARRGGRAFRAGEGRQAARRISACSSAMRAGAWLAISASTAAARCAGTGSRPAAQLATWAREAPMARARSACQRAPNRSAPAARRRSGVMVEACCPELAFNPILFADVQVIADADASSLFIHGLVAANTAVWAVFSPRGHRDQAMAVCGDFSGVADRIAHRSVSMAPAGLPGRVRVGSGGDAQPVHLDGAGLGVVAIRHLEGVEMHRVSVAARAVLSGGDHADFGQRAADPFAGLGVGLHCEKAKNGHLGLSCVRRANPRLTRALYPNRLSPSNGIVRRGDHEMLQMGRA
ncbi:MAG: hypothetical protein IT538_11970 [Variibacter sp.]|nr:hypothetical protein [Variibacter sp.]